MSARQAPVADVLPRRALMQPNALDEAIRGTDERDADVSGARLAKRKAQLTPA